MGKKQTAVAFAQLIGEGFPPAAYGLLTMALGFVAYGLSIQFYIQAQKERGAAKTSAFLYTITGADPKPAPVSFI